MLPLYLIITTSWEEYKLSKTSKYSIGDASKLCNVSTKALRYYDKIGLVKPQRSNCNNYRYYNDDSLHLIPVIKYYKQMGFKLYEMTQLINDDCDNTYSVMQDVFESKMAELDEERQGLRVRDSSVHDWYNLVQEAKSVQENQITDVSVQFFPGTDYLFLEQGFDGNIRDAIINIEFTDYVERIENNITGPVIIKFNSHQQRVVGSENCCILQKTLLPCAPEKTIFVGAQPMARCYHIGNHSTINQTYEKIKAWAESNNYLLTDECYERYVIDYWTTQDSDKFVTEIMIPVTSRC